MQPGTASNLYWTSTYNVTEQASPANTGTITFEPTTQAFGFDQVVTFNSLSTNSSTVINGDNITTGTIKSSDYDGPPEGYGGFSNQGMGIDLNDGSIHAQQFHVNANGAAGFKGSINLTAPATTTRGVQSITMQPNLGSIELSHASQTTGDITYPSGVTRLSSQGMYTNNAGLDVYSGTLGQQAKTSVHITGVSNMRESSTAMRGVSFLTGLYARAVNNALDDNTPADTRPVESYGAVVENLRADGFVGRVHHVPNGGTTYDLPNDYATYFVYNRTNLNLPNTPRMGQTVKIVRLGGSANVVRSTIQSSVSGVSNKIFVMGEGYVSSEEVTYSEEFIFQGDYWVRVKAD
tara:strand:- start:594 stop:1640 length:1047 start_codon:yes stop_codon:yes gene_type:complete